MGNNDYRKDRLFTCGGSLPRCKWNMNALSVFPWNVHAPTNISWETTVSIGIPKLARFRSTPGRMFPSPCNYRFDHRNRIIRAESCVFTENNIVGCSSYSLSDRVSFLNFDYRNFGIMEFSGTSLRDLATNPYTTNNCLQLPCNRFVC